MSPVAGSVRAAHRTGLLLGVLGAIAFGTLPIIGKLAYQTGAEPLSLLTVRYLVASLLLVMVSHLTGRSLALDTRTTVRLLVLGAGAYAFESSLYFLALEHATAGVVGLIFYSYPLWTNVIGFATGLERPTARIVTALILGSLGVASIFTITTTGLLGPLLALGSALAVAVYLVIAQVVTRGVTAGVSATYTAAGASVSCGLAALLLRHDLPPESIGHGAALGLATAIAFLCLYAAIERIGSARTAVANMTEPVTTVVLAAIILGEAITGRIVIGAVLVISALPVLAAGGPRADAALAPDSA